MTDESDAGKINYLASILFDYKRRELLPRLRRSGLSSPPAATATRQYGCSVYSAAFRPGECLGLKWSDVDLKTGVIQIRQQATEVYGHVEVGALKTKSSVRDIVIVGSALDALRRRHKAPKREEHSSRFCFTTPADKLLDRNSIRRRHFIAFCRQADITGLRPHDFRHSMTSHAIAAGISPIVVARRLGHGSTRMTLDRYGHQLPGQQQEAAATLESRLQPSGRKAVRPK